MTFPAQFLDEIRARVPLEGVISRRVRLTRRGRELTGLCPFHNEKTPSFTVSEEKGFFHCFGCGAHGDVIGFVMRDEGLGFPEAIERLASDAGLALPKREPRNEAREKERVSLYGVMEAATAWFEAELAGQRGAQARRYLETRGLSAETIAEFRLGYAPDSRDALRGALIKGGITEAMMLTTGLLIAPDDGGTSYDRFRGRVIFPIADRRGRIIAFGGRALGDLQPKYLNSPETPLFHKGSVLYGHHFAAGPARKAGRVVAVEGYMDVIAMHQAGINDAVAPLGTALTELQLEALWRLADTPILCFDGDKAGARAAARAVERALPRLGAKRSLAFATLPTGEDPDTVIHDGGPAALLELLDGAAPLSEQLWQGVTGGRPLDTPEARARANKLLSDQVEQIPDRDLRFYFLGHFKRLLRNSGWKQGTGKPFSAQVAEAPVTRGQALGPRRQGAAQRRECTLLQTLLNFPELVVEQRETLARLRFETPRFAAVVTALLEWAEEGHENGETLPYELAQRGFGGVMDELVGGHARYLDWAANRARADLADARTQLVQAIEMQRRWVEHPSALRDAERALADEMTEDSWERLRETVRQAHDSGESDVEVPGYGDASQADGH
jgi:DNA primase